MCFNARYIVLTGEFPVTNHVAVDEGNLGWAKGVFDDGIPFEAELWKYEGHTNITIMIPAEYKVMRVNDDVENDNVVQFQMSSEYVNGGVLPVGMASLGHEMDDEVIHNWVYYLEEKNFINFVDEWRNGSVQYVVDINGNVFCEIIVELEDEDMVYASVDIDWNEFPIRKNMKKKIKPFTVIR